MKLNIFISALLTAVTFGACSNEGTDTIAVAGGERIDFEVNDASFLTEQTRAIKTTFESTDYFNVIAFANGTIEPLVMSHAQVGKTSNTQLWQTSDHYYWPKAQTEMTFYAYYPTSLSSKFSTLSPPNAPAFTYTVDPTSIQEDLLGATTVYEVNTPNDENRHVPLSFKHLLCAVCFTVGTNSKYGTFKNITLKGVNKTGKYVFGTDTEYWTDLADPVQFSRDIDVEAARPNSTTDTSSSGTAIIPSTSPILVVPQVLGENAKIYIEFIDENNVTHQLETTPDFKNLKVGTLVNYQLSISSKFDLTVQTNIANYTAETFDNVSAVME